MEVVFNKKFKKAIVKLPKNVQERFREKFALFIQDQFHPLLNNHSLHGEYNHTRSINVTGDYRALYIKNEEKIVFIAVGTHSELY